MSRAFVAVRWRQEGAPYPYYVMCPMLEALIVEMIPEAKVVTTSYASLAIDQPGGPKLNDRQKAARAVAVDVSLHLFNLLTHTLPRSTPTSVLKRHATMRLPLLRTKNPKASVLVPSLERATLSRKAKRS